MGSGKQRISLHDGAAIFALLLLLLGALTVASMSRRRDGFAVDVSSLNAAGAASLCSIAAAQVDASCGANANVKGTLGVNGATTLGGALTVAGSSTLNGNVQVKGALCLADAAHCLSSADIAALKTLSAAAAKPGSSPSFGTVTATSKLCVGGTCVTETQLKSLLGLQAQLTALQAQDAALQTQETALQAQLTKMQGQGQSMSPGLRFTCYSGYFNDNTNFFVSAAATGTGQTSDGTNLATLTRGQQNVNQGSLFSVELVGFFLCQATGSHTFWVSSDDAAYLWVGPSAAAGYTVANALIRDGSLHGMAEQRGAISMTQGQTYPIRLQYGQNYGGCDCQLSFQAPGAQRTYNGTGYYFCAPANPGSGGPKCADASDVRQNLAAYALAMPTPDPASEVALTPKTPAALANVASLSAAALAGTNAVYSLSFRVNLTNTNGNWRNLLYYGVSDSPSDRSPGMWQTPGGTALHFRHESTQNENTGVDALPMPSTNAWHHVVFTVDGSTIRPYVNGAPMPAYNAALGSGQYYRWSNGSCTIAQKRLRARIADNGYAQASGAQMADLFMLPIVLSDANVATLYSVLYNSGLSASGASLCMPLRVARYVQLDAATVDCMNVAELQVFDDSGINVAAGKKVTLSSGYQGNMFPGANLVDGNTSNFAHTSCGDKGWMRVDLGAATNVTRMRLYNRVDCCQSRTAGMIVSLLDGNMSTVYSSAPLTANMVQDVIPF